MTNSTGKHIVYSSCTQSVLERHYCENSSKDDSLANIIKNSELIMVENNLLIENEIYL